MWNNRIQDLYTFHNAETTLEIEGATFDVVYNQDQNQFEVLTMKIVGEYPEGFDFFEMDEIFQIAEDMLQDEHYKNFDYGNEL